VLGLELCGLKLNAPPQGECRQEVEGRVEVLHLLVVLFIHAIPEVQDDNRELRRSHNGSTAQEGFRDFSADASQRESDVPGPIIARQLMKLFNPWLHVISPVGEIHLRWGPNPPPVPVAPNGHRGLYLSARAPFPRGEGTERRGN